MLHFVSERLDCLLRLQWKLLRFPFNFFYRFADRTEVLFWAARTSRIHKTLLNHSFGHLDSSKPLFKVWRNRKVERDQIWYMRTRRHFSKSARKVAFHFELRFAMLDLASRSCSLCTVWNDGKPRTVVNAHIQVFEKKVKAPCTVSMRTLLCN